MLKQVPILVSWKFRQGETFKTAKYFPGDANGNALDLTGATAHAQLKATLTSTAALNLTESSGIELDDTDNSVAMNVAHTATFGVTAGLYLMDLFVLLASGDRVLVFSGNVVVDGAVTPDP